MSGGFLDFEQPILDLEGKIEELQRLDDPALDIAEDVVRLRDKLDKLLRNTYSKLTPWQKVQVARHPSRPRLKRFIAALIEDFVPLCGDRLFAEDAAIIGGLGRFAGHPVVVIGQERGEDLTSRLKHNFGMPKPEGYRKAQRLLKLAGRFQMPVLTFIDTPGAYPGIGAEERGQAEAIARSIETCLETPVPIIATVIGEGGSGGAIAIGVADRVLMLEHAVYSVISPEGCASILWRSAEHAAEAAEALKLTAQDLLKLGIIDEIIAEPLGGAHRNPVETLASVQRTLTAHLNSVLDDRKDRRKQRRQKFLAMAAAA
jgi:acetyl-CoA carboxylase carboxyl transferase subunit alpha